MKHTILEIVRDNLAQFAFITDQTLYYEVVVSTLGEQETCPECDGTRYIGYGPGDDLLPCFDCSDGTTTPTHHTTYNFPIPVSSLDGALLHSTEKAITLMRSNPTK